MFITKLPWEENNEASPLIADDKKMTNERSKEEDEDREKVELKFYQFKADGKTLDI